MKETSHVYIDENFIVSDSLENKENAKLHATEVALCKLTRLKGIDAISVKNEC